MHKRKNEIQDIYQGGEHDFEKDFTPQIAKERLEERQRDLRRSQIASIFFGSLVIVLSVALVSIVIRNFLKSRTPSLKISTKETPFIPRHSLPIESLWVMDYQQVASQLDPETPGPKPLSTKWVKNAAYHIVMGQQALYTHEKDQALEHFLKVAEIYPDIQGLHGALGTLYLQNDEYALAAQHLEKALAEEENFDVVNNLGSAYIGAEEYDKAEKNLKRALELRPENPGCYKNLAALYRKMGRDNEAIYNFEKYFDMQPGDLDTMQAYGLYLTKIGRWKEAADFLTQLTQEVTDVAPIYFLLAQVQVQNGQQDKAIAALKRGVQLIDPQLALAWMDREEFNTVRNSSEFKTLADQLEIASISLGKH
ncbi:MAG: tetratricopeptide repeat protein [Kiritimatiellales bacterium]|nr:tetratricopeptide repeat protein [Kiritimatiellales bacterium]